MTNLPVTDNKMNFIREKTREDFQMDQLRKYIQNGWPDKRESCHPNALEYWNFRDELAVIDDIIIKGERIVIPKAARHSLLQNLHEGHIGIEKSIQRARSAIFWPGITKDIKEVISTCATCMAHQPSQSKETLLSHDIPTRPWQKVASDLFTWNNKQFLVTVDYYSRYFEIDELPSTTSNAIIKRMCQHFARHGIPQILISDNGPQYISEEFAQFAKAWDFEHRTSSPHYSQSNGLAEKTVHTAKQLLSKAKESGTNFEKVLLHYRATPVDNLASPAQLLMGRQIRSTMPATSNHLNPKIIVPDQVQETRIAMQKRQEKYYNQNARSEATEMKPGQAVQVQLTPGSRWKSGTIIKKDDMPRSYHVKVDNGTYRRNSRFIKEDKRSKYDIGNGNNDNGRRFYNGTGNDNNDNSKRFNNDNGNGNNDIGKRFNNKEEYKKNDIGINSNHTVVKNNNTDTDKKGHTMNGSNCKWKTNLIQGYHNRNHYISRPVTNSHLHFKYSGYQAKQNRFGRTIKKPNILDL